MKAFRNFVERYQTIPASDWDLITTRFRRKELSKNYNLLEAGKICRHLYFLESGLLRFFVIKSGLEVNKFFTIAPYFFTSQASFNTNKPANEYIQTLERSVVWETTYKENNYLLKLDSWNSFARKITQEVQFFTEEILQELQTETAENRYKKILKNQPELLQRIPLKHLASFLGVAPQSLSRIRRNIDSNQLN